MRGTVMFVTAAVAGAYSVQHEDVTVGGYVCGEHQTARVYYPGDAAGGKFPLISFAHGYNCPGTEAYSSYSTLNTAVAAAGYVVIVLESASWPLECSSEWKDQMRSIAWAKSSKFVDVIDFSKKTGVMGHSMGGGATYHSAGQASAVKDNNIGAAVALHPQIDGLYASNRLNASSLLPITNSLVPIFFGTGSKDDVISPTSVKSVYSKTKGVPKVFMEIEGAVHDEPMSPPWGKGRPTPYAIAMFDCHLKGSKNQCSIIYGTGSGALCSGKVKMTDCEHANEPHSDQVLV